MSAPDAGLFVAVDGQASGPFDIATLGRMRAEGKLSPETLYWYEGLAEWAPIGAAELWSKLEAAPPSLPMKPRNDDEHDAIFSALVKESWSYFHLHERNNQVDDVLVGALISATVENGWSLIDVTSDGSNHFLRFEDFKDQSRVYFRMTHLTTSLAAAKAGGNVMSIIVGYGERTTNLSSLWSTLKQELRSGYLQSAEPGTITFDADLQSNYITCQIDLYWTIENYVGKDMAVDFARLERDTGAVIHALRRYLRGRTGRS